jgi:heterodisulfide reductase subunit B
MKVSVWDTYVTKKDGNIMHFDIIVPQSMKDERAIFGFGKQYLQQKQQEGQALTAKECSFCHVQEPKAEWENSINEKGYYIYEMEGCN